MGLNILYSFSHKRLDHGIKFLAIDTSNELLSNLKDIPDKLLINFIEESSIENLRSVLKDFVEEKN